MAKIYTKATWFDEALGGTEKYRITEFSAAVTMTIASPAVFTSTGHKLAAGDPVYFKTTGVLPTGLTQGLIYFVIAAGLTANAFEVSALPGGSAVVTSGSQSGTHSVRSFCANIQVDMITAIASAGTEVNSTIMGNIENGIDAIDALVDPVVNGGWTLHGSTWTYASASTFTVSGDQTALFQTGTRLKFTQTTVKYAAVVSSVYSSPNTTVTIAVNTDYVIANAAISAKYYSGQANPTGWPGFFNFAVAWTNVTVGNGTVIAKYSIVGRLVKFTANLTFGTTTSIAGSIAIAPPIAPAASYGNYMPIGDTSLIDWATALYMGAAVLMSSGTIDIRVIGTAGTYANWANVNATVPFTWGSTDMMSIDGNYFL
jgi:hypothetical protein